MKTVLLLALLILSGCATSSVLQQLQADPNADLATVIRNVTVTDLDAALADATAHNDTLALACYPVLKKYVTSNPIGQNDIKGPISGFQRARDVSKGIGNSGVPDDLRLGCAALVQDVREFAVRMSIMASPK